MNAPKNFDLTSECSFSSIVEAYHALERMGKKPSIDELVSLAPHLETEIRKSFPTIMLLDMAVGEGNKLEISMDNIPPVVSGCAIKKEIGRGGMGVVFHAHQPDLNRDVAIKVIRTNADMSQHAERFELERYAMARLDHPNIIPAYNFSQDGDLAYLIMKLIPGVGLNQILNADAGDYESRFLRDQLRTDWAFLGKIAADVASGLNHAHNNGLIHRDIKPGNLLLQTDGKVWISDFGLAKMNDYAQLISLTGDVIGTPKYMAPEQLSGNCDARSDIYSLGLTLFELATGQSAHNGDSKQQQTANESTRRIFDPREANPDVPEDLAFIIRKATSFLPEDRYQSASELEVVLRRFVDGRPADRRRKKRKPDAIYRKEFKRTVILTAIGSIVLCSALTYVLMLGSTQQTSAKEETNIIDFLADNGTERLREKFTAEILEKATEASKELDLSEKATNQLRAELNVIHEKYLDGDVNHKTLGELLDNYEGSTLPIVTRVWRNNTAIQNSKLSDAEKKNAKDIVRRFAFLTLQSRLSSEDAIKLNTRLTQGVSVPAEEFYQMRFSDRSLRNWLSIVDQQTKELILPNEQFDLTDEVNEAFTRLCKVGLEDKISPGYQTINPRQLNGNSGSTPVITEKMKREFEKVQSQLSPEQTQQLLRMVNHGNR